MRIIKNTSMNQFHTKIHKVINSSHTNTSKDNNNWHPSILNFHFDITLEKITYITQYGKAEH